MREPHKGIHCFGPGLIQLGDQWLSQSPGIGYLKMLQS